MKIVLFFTLGNSLKSWSDSGLLEREVLLYKKFIQKGIGVTFITYGDTTDYLYKERLGGIHVVPFYAFIKKPKFRIIKFLNSLILPIILRNEIKQADILKTNQMWGGWIAVLSKFVFKKKLIVRCGYELYHNSLRSDRSLLWRYLFWSISWITYKCSDKIIMTSNGNKNFITQTFLISPAKINTLVNYIAIDKFRKISCNKYRNKLLFIGRLSKEKNIFHLLDAILQTEYELDIIGGGDQKSEIEAYIRKYNIKANLLGCRANDRIPNIINHYPVYILPSNFENNPKTLLEAMACESAVIGTNVDGIKEIITHNENGLLCETDSGSIGCAIEKLMPHEELQSRLGRNAREFVMENCRLELIADNESKLYKEMLNIFAEL